MASVLVCTSQQYPVIKKTQFFPIFLQNDLPRNISIWKIHKKVEIQSIEIPLRKISSKTNGNLDKFEIDTILAYRIRLRQNTYTVVHK